MFLIPEHFPFSLTGFSQHHLHSEARKCKSKEATTITLHRHLTQSYFQKMHV